MIESGDIITLSEQVVKPFYQHKATFAVSCCAMPFRIRASTSTSRKAPFLWLWFEDLPIHCQELYERATEGEEPADRARPLLSPASTTLSGATARSASASTTPRARIWCVAASPSWPTRINALYAGWFPFGDERKACRCRPLFYRGGQRFV